MDIAQLEQLEEQLALIKLIVGDYQEFCQRGKKGELTHGDISLYQEIIRVEGMMKTLQA